MNLLGTKVTDSITGITGTVIAQAQYLHDAEGVMVAYGDKFETAWLSLARVVQSFGETNKPAEPASAKAAAAPKSEPAPAAKSAPTNGATPPAALAAAPAPSAATETYAKVAAAFIVLGKAGQGATIQKILATHNAAHAKQIADNAPALADVLTQALAAIAALQPATA